MNSTKKISRNAGLLLLSSFVIGIVIFQFLQTSVLSLKDFALIASENESNLILSTLLGAFSGIASIIVSILFFPIFKKQHFTLAFLYVAFCLINFVAIMIDNHNVLEMLEFSKAFAINSGEASNSTTIMKSVLAKI